MKLIARLTARLTDAASVIAGIAVILMMIQITVDVIGRYVLNIAIPATIAIVSNYYMVVVAFLPLALAERQDNHISVELVTELMPQRIQRGLYGWGQLFSAVVFSYLACAGYQEAMNKFEISAFIIERDYHIPVWPGYYLLPIGAALMALMLFCRFAGYLTGNNYLTNAKERDGGSPSPGSDQDNIAGHL